MKTLHECDMSYYCLNRNPDSDNETDYCNIVECAYMKLLRDYKELKERYDGLIQYEKDRKELIKECESDNG